ncbi:MAG TPA: hypothetical protein DEO88_02165 [Syntrophobacteraceae bacterium]|nr:hypothetical protein [Syntrophobacteraceae bacterium]
MFHIEHQTYPLPTANMMEYHIFQFFTGYLFQIGALSQRTNGPIPLLQAVPPGALQAGTVGS